MPISPDDIRDVTLREQFAAMAMQGMLVNHRPMAGANPAFLANYARDAVMAADALITALNHPDIGRVGEPD